MTLRYSHLSQGHKKKAVETLGAQFGHHMDTKAEISGSSEKSKTAQAIDFIGAGRGHRTPTEQSSKGF